MARNIITFLLLATITFFSCSRDSQLTEPITVKSIILPQSIHFSPDSADFNDSVTIYWMDFIKTYYPNFNMNNFKFKVYIQDSLAKIENFDSTVLIIRVPKVIYKPSRIRIVSGDTNFYLRNFLFLYPKQGLLWLEKTRTKPGDTLQVFWENFLNKFNLFKYLVNEPKIKIGNSVAEVINVTPISISFIVPNLPPGIYRCNLIFLDKNIKLTDSLIVYDPPINWENIILNAQTIEISLNIPVIFKTESGNPNSLEMFNYYLKSTNEFPVKFKLYKTNQNKYSFNYEHFGMTEYDFVDIKIVIDTTTIPYSINFELILSKSLQYSVPGRTFYFYVISRRRKFSFVGFPFKINNDNLICEISGSKWSENIYVLINNTESKTVTDSQGSYTQTSMENYIFNPEKWSEKHKIILKIY